METLRRLFSSKSQIKVFCKYMVSLLLLILLFSQIQFHDLFKNFEFNIINLGFLLSGMFLFFISWIFQTIRFHLLILRFTGHFINTVKLTLISIFMGSFLPSNVGIDVAKSIYLKKNSSASWHDTITLTFIDRLSGFTVLTFMGIIYCLVGLDAFFEALNTVTFEISAEQYIIIIGIFIITLFLIFHFIRRTKHDSLKNNFIKIHQIMKSVSKVTYLCVFSLSIISQACRLFALFCFALLFEIQIPVFDFLFILSFTAFVCLLPISIGAFGIREGTIAGCLLLLGANISPAVSAAMIFRVPSLILAISGAFIFIFSKNKNIRGNL